MKKIKAGLFGFGVVGGGIYHVLSKKPQLGVDIKKVVIKHPEKKRDAPSHLFTTNADAVLKDDEIELVIELIDDAEAALDIVMRAMQSGKSVISANKKMISENHELLINTSKKHHVSFLYEAAVCGSIPIIRNLEEYFDNDLLTFIKGIINGSTNYILSQMSTKGLDYTTALKEAQEKGFAESDPTLDVQGIDAAYKLKIIILHAFGKLVKDNAILRKGITTLTPFDFKYAKEKGYVIKLLANCIVNDIGEFVEISVMPTFLPKYHALRLTNNEFNGILIGSQLADEQFFYGKGAGRYPTSSAVLSDISAYKYDYKYEFKKGYEKLDFINSGEMKVYLCSEIKHAPKPELFLSVEERYEGKGISYIVGRISMKNLTQLIDENRYSIIRFED